MSNLRLYSTLSRRTEEFVPLKPGEVGLYACGVTTYDDAHLGHARQAIFFDVLRKWLERRGYRVNYVRNFTDIDDKIIARAAKENRDPLELSGFYVKETTRDLAALKVDSATREPKVTEHIKEIIAFIGELVEKGVAYAQSGEVLFDVTKFPDYGKLSGRKLDELQNADVSDYKRHPQDFSLWKAAKPGEPSWPSPWGPGRPGWHIECSVLAKTYLGDRLDIHGGGLDLIFPHHENEIAQSESLTGLPFANYWVHNGLVQVDGVKMSKSLGNFITVKQAIAEHEPEVIRLAILSVHYSSPLDFTADLFRAAEKRLTGFYRTLVALKAAAKPGEAAADNPLKLVADELVIKFEAAMDDNLNTALALAHLSDAQRRINQVLEDKKMPSQELSAGATACIAAVGQIAKILRVFEEEPSAYLSRARERFLKSRGLTAGQIEERIAARAAAKAAKDYAASDRIRDELATLGIELRDSKDGTVWDVAPDNVQH